MRLRLIVILLCFSSAFQAVGQDYKINIFKPEVEAWKDTISKKKKQFIFEFDARRSFVLDQGAKINGLKIGMGINNTHHFGLGFYGLREPVLLPNVEVTITDLNGNTSTERRNMNFDFTYVSLFYERILLSNRKWELSVPFHIGSATITGTYKDSMEVAHKAIENTVPLWSISTMGQYNIFSWFAIGTGLGYRRTITPEARIHKAFDAPFYIVKGKVMIVPLYKAIFKKDKLEKADPNIEER